MTTLSASHIKNAASYQRIAAGWHANVIQFRLRALTATRESEIDYWTHQLRHDELQANQCYQVARELMRIEPNAYEHWTLA